MKKDKEKTTINIKHFLALFFLIGISQAALCDDVQNALNLDYFRTPEASAFKKYGEELVNEYTGTADISVPLYTIKCKDIEIPLVLRYDASGIKVEQEASWVGLGWNLMVGGCINYVCAGAHDQYNHSCISNQTWTEYLTTTHTSSDGKQNFSYSNDDINTWMETVPHSYAFDPPYREDLSQEMQNYLMWGFGERDFYSVNVMGKSFKFFIDPATLNVYTIGENEEDFKIEPDYTLEAQTGIGHQSDVKEWKITDSNGYIYYFNCRDRESDYNSTEYTVCWYLTKVQSPLGETVDFSYIDHQEFGRQRMTETINHLSINCYENVNYAPAANPISFSCGNGWVRNHYLTEIKTSNQTVLFDTSESKECSGRKLNGIKVLSYDSTEIKNIKFSYGSFGHSDVGGNYAPAQDTEAELRLKLENVKEISSTDTLTTSFSYNPLNLPSKRSCAQDFWGYYNGQDNSSAGCASSGVNGHTLLPTPTRSMNGYLFGFDELKNIKGANRNSDGMFMQAAMLNKVSYPTGGYTTYEYEPHSFTVNYKESQEYQEYLNTPDVNIYKSFSYTPYNSTTFIVYNDPVEFTLTDELPFGLYVRCNGNAINGREIAIIIIPKNGSGTVRSIPVTYMSSDEPVLVLNDTLHAGNYELRIGAPSNVDQGYAIGCWLKGYYTSPDSNFDHYKTYSKIGGGVRIRKISNYDKDESLINYITYNYDDNKGTTGILLNEIETIEPFDYTYMEPGNSGSGYSFFLIPHYIYGTTITPGQSKFPAFFTSCNPGNVGYSMVKKSKYNGSDSLEKSIETQYINHKPESFTKYKYYRCFNNGKILSQASFGADGNIISKVENEYVYHYLREDDPDKDRWYSTNMVARDCIRFGIGIQYYDRSQTANRFEIYKYPYISSKIELSQSVTTEYCPDGSTIVKTKDYLYNGINHQVSQIDENTSLSDQTLRTKITYSADGEDYMSRWMQDAHRLNDVVENKTLLVENGQEHCISTQRTNYTSRYNNGTSHYLPASLSTSIGDNAPETRAVYSYDDSLNVRSVAVDGMETVYIWSYNSQYPIAKIEGVTYADVENALGASTLATLLRKPEPSAEDLMQIRNAINGIGGHVTTYTYKPLVGITSETLPNGNTNYYEYDSFGRLTRVIDHDGSVISTNSYNYRKP